MSMSKSMLIRRQQVTDVMLSVAEILMIDPKKMFINIVNGRFSAYQANLTDDGVTSIFRVTPTTWVIGTNVDNGSNAPTFYLQIPMKTNLYIVAKMIVSHRQIIKQLMAAQQEAFRSLSMIHGIKVMKRSHTATGLLKYGESTLAVAVAPIEGYEKTPIFGGRYTGSNGAFYKVMAFGLIDHVPHFSVRMLGVYNGQQHLRLQSDDARNMRLLTTNLGDAIDVMVDLIKTPDDVVTTEVWYI